MWQRKPGFAGSFYPANPEKLKNEIINYLSKASVKKLEHPVSFIVPHAGYIYSGPVAAYSYAQLKGNPVDVVIVLAPSHRARFNGASIITNGIFSTPLGDITVDSTIAGKLLDEDIFSRLKKHISMNIPLRFNCLFYRLF